MSNRLQLQYVNSGVVTYPPGAAFGPRTMADYELVWIIEGEVVYEVGDDRVPCPPGTIVLARPKVRDAFTWDREQATRHAYFHFGVSHFPDDWPEPAAWPVRWELPEMDIVRPLFRYVLACGGVAGTYVQPVSPMLTRAIEMLLGALVVGPMRQELEYEQAWPEPVGRALRYMQQVMEEDPSIPVTLDDLASEAAVSPEHLCRLFRSTFNVSPMEALRLLRLDLAVTLLARSNLSLKQIAHRCGFASQYHFSKRFSLVYDEPPSVVRKRLAEGEPPPVNPLMKRLRAD